ncbi:cysteine desulfurase [archaeon]|nr:cysteine desulfurase [archaeon]
MKAYFDNASTTCISPEVLEVMKPYYLEKYGNASTMHQWGVDASEALEKSRESIAKFMKVKPRELVFTGCGTESDNLALKGIAFSTQKKHLITTQIEHPAVLKTAVWLEKQGFDVDYLSVDSQGFVKPETLEKKIRNDTALVSIMTANNEIGTIEPIEELAKITHDHGALFHTDAVQAFGKIPLMLEHVDLLSASAHKLHGPKGIGLLYVKEGTQLTPLLHGGGHEYGLRSATENMPGIVGFAKAVELAEKHMENEAKRQSNLRDKLIKSLESIDDSWLNGPRERLPNNAHFGFDFVEGESLVLRLDANGIAVGTGSACSSHDLMPSHVLLAIGLPPEKAHGSLRLTMSKYTTEEEVDYVIDCVPNVVGDLRKLSPLVRRS